MIVVGRTATQFMTFVFGGNPNFSTVIKDLLLVVGVIARFVLNNVFTIIHMFFLVLGNVGHVINEMLTKTCSALFGFLSLIVDGINHVPFVSLDNPFDPVPCVRRPLEDCNVTAAHSAGHGHYGQNWELGGTGARHGRRAVAGDRAVRAGHARARETARRRHRGVPAQRGVCGPRAAALAVDDVPLVDVMDGLGPAALGVRHAGPQRVDRGPRPRKGCRPVGGRCTVPAPRRARHDQVPTPWRRTWCRSTG